MTREEAIGVLQHIFNLGLRIVPIFIDSTDREALKIAIDSLQTDEVDEVCEWIKYDYRTVCPKNHDVDNPYWRIPESNMDALKYCPYCGKKIKVKGEAK